MRDAAISWIGGPVLRARTGAPFRVNEAVLVGPARLLGEVVHLDRGEIVAQVYEDTTGLKPGDPVVGTGEPLSVPLGPDLLGRIFDGLLRPLSGWDDFIDPGAVDVPGAVIPFRPTVGRGDSVGAGAAFGSVAIPGVRQQACLVPPGVSGQVLEVADEGRYAPDEPVLWLRVADGGERELSMRHRWPVRRPRPVAGRVALGEPMLTGQRILDTLFPVARGGRAAIPGGFGTGKTILQQALAKFSDADIVIYIGCGERGNEMAEVLEEFVELTDARSDERLLGRTVVIANTSNMPVAAREASIYTGVTVAEYFRDQGLNVALMADSTSRWAEALREISGRLGELPAESGYPAYLSSRLAEFYERAGRVRTLGGGSGSLTIIGAISPPGADFSEPVTTQTQRFVGCLWQLDTERAQARLYPAIHPLRSYSNDVPTLTEWWESQINPRWSQHRRQLLALLEEQAKLDRMARIVGMDALPESQRILLTCADLAVNGFLRQSALSTVDAQCSPERQAAMLRLILRFTELAREAGERGVGVERITALDVWQRLQRMAEEMGDDQMGAFDELGRAVEAQLASLTEGAGDHAS